MADYFVYCDESGNTGVNYVDPQQPIYVLASWWVEAGLERGAEDAVYELFEHATRKRLKGPRGQRATLKLFSKLGEVGCVPLFVLAEKRYCVAGKIVETFLDPLYNPLLSQEFTGEVVTKQAIADIVYDLPDQALVEFFTAYRGFDGTGLRRSLQTITTALSERGHAELANAMMSSSVRLDDLARDEKSAGEEVPTYRTLNMTIFASLICQIENLGRVVRAGQITLVHDQTKEFQHTYEWVLALFAKAKKAKVTLPSGFVIPFGFDHLRRFRTLGSAESPLIQAAHLLATSLCSYSRDVRLRRPIQGGLLEIGRQLLPGLLVFPQVASVVGSAVFMREIFAPVLSGD